MAMKKMKKVYNEGGVAVPGMYEGESVAGTVMDDTQEQCAGPGPGCRGRGRRIARKRRQTQRRARHGKGRRY